MNRKAFTLIELLVVIAIIAILAAILFPVFAQAKLAAKKSSDLSNQKQMDLAIIQYQGDSDDCFPEQTGLSTALGGWPWNYNQYIPFDYPAGAGSDGSYSIRVQSSPNSWANSIQPYAKNFGVMDTVGAPLTSAGGASNALVGKAKAKSGLTFNGDLSSYNGSGVVQPARLIMIYTGRGLADMDGGSLASPALQCPNPNQPCTYVPYSAGCSAATQHGAQDAWFGYSGSAWVYNKGMNQAFVDGHAKFKNMFVTDINHPDESQYAAMDANGFPQSSWWDGCHLWIFRPDWNP